MALFVRVKLTLDLCPSYNISVVIWSLLSVMPTWLAKKSNIVCENGCVWPAGFRHFFHCIQEEHHPGSCYSTFFSFKYIVRWNVVTPNISSSDDCCCRRACRCDGLRLNILTTNNHRWCMLCANASLIYVINLCWLAFQMYLVETKTFDPKRNMLV